MEPLVERSPARPELRALTSVRAFAALDVVLLHTLFELGGQGMWSLPRPVIKVVANGQSAVSFFFVLSGFILAYTYCEAREGLHTLRGSRAKFWRARFARIYPLYFLSFVLDAPRAVAYFLGATPSRSLGLAKAAVAGGTYATLLQSWFPRLTNAWNTPGWSLSTETFFYLLFPAILALTKTWPARHVITAALVLWAIPLGAYAALALGHVTDLNHGSIVTLWRSFPPLRLAEFALGVGVGRLYLSGALRDHMKAMRVACLCAAALAFAVLGLNLGLPANVTQGTLAAPLFAVVICALALGAIPGMHWLDSPVLLLLGRASYAVYILHEPIAWWFTRAIACVGVGVGVVEVTEKSPLVLVSFLVFMELTCVGAFLWIEDPARRAITTAGRRRG